MPRTLRALNVLTALVALASALAVLVSDVVDPAYRAAYGDPLGLVAAYVAFYAVVVWSFARARPSAPWLAVVRALGAYCFLAVCAVVPWAALGTTASTKGVGAYLYLSAFAALTREWTVRSPGRYVYQLFDWGPQASLLFFAFVFLGRGAWNTINAFALTRDRWVRLRMRAPLLGRLFTALPVGLTVFSVWGFFAVARLQAVATSAEAIEVAQLVLDGVDCDAVRAKAGTTTSDVRRRGDRRFDVQITYGCGMTMVLVHTEDDRYGTAVGSRAGCCAS